MGKVCYGNAVINVCERLVYNECVRGLPHKCAVIMGSLLWVSGKCVVYGNCVVWCVYGCLLSLHRALVLMTDGEMNIFNVRTCFLGSTYYGRKGSNHSLPNSKNGFKNQASTRMT